MRKLLEKIRHRIQSKGNAGGVLSVLSGTLIGQGVLILATPFLTRLYSPAEMGLYSVFVAIVGLFSITIALHYELAIPLPKMDGQAKLLMRLAVLITLIMSALIGLLLYVWRKPILSHLHAEALDDYLALVPVALSLTGIITIYNLWLTRKRLFGITAYVKASQGIGQTIPQIALGYLKTGVLGLIVGQLVGLIINVLIVTKKIPQFFAVKSTSYQTRRVLVLARKHRHFPLLTTISSMINSFSAQAPVLLLAFTYSAEVTGFFALSFRVLQMPARFLGQSVSQVFFSAAAKAKHTGSIGIITTRLFNHMMSFSIATFVTLAMISPDLFVAAFGKQWEEAGVYSQILMPWIFFMFITTTLNILISVLNKQKFELYFQIIYVGVLCIALGAGIYLNNPLHTIAAFGLAGAIGLMIKTVVLLRLASADFRSIGTHLVSEIPFVVLPIVTIIGIKRLTDVGHWEVSIIGGLLMLLAHAYNLRIRNVYGF